MLATDIFHILTMIDLKRRDKSQMLQEKRILLQQNLDLNLL